MLHVTNSGILGYYLVQSISVNLWKGLHCIVYSLEGLCIFTVALNQMLSRNTIGYVMAGKHGSSTSSRPLNVDLSYVQIHGFA